MSSRQPQDQASESTPSPPHQPAYPQGFASINAPTTLRQPTPSGWASTSMSSPPSAPGARATQETLPSSHSIVVREPRDFFLALSIQAAQGDTRECPWYGVWARVLQNYIFRNADESRTACTCVPQYSLIASHDSGRLSQSGNSSWSDISMGSPSSDRHLMTPGSPLPGPHSIPRNSTPDFSPRSQEIFGGPLPPLTPSPSLPLRHVPYPDSPTTQHVTRMQARRAGEVFSGLVSTRPLPQSSSSSYQYPSDGILPKTPPRPTTGLSNASFRIPDFVQILEHAQWPFPVVPDHVIRRVIMIVEIKPELGAGKRFDWEPIWKDQVREQVLHAFEADHTLKCVGVIIAAGRRWVYGTASRGKVVPKTMSEKRDPTFPSTGPPVPSSDDSMVEEWPEIQRVFPSFDIPDFFPQTENGHIYGFDLLDAGGESLKTFEGILKNLRHHNKDIWN